MNIAQLLNQLPGAVAQGLIWGIMAIGVYITFRILDIADLTVDGSFATGGAAAAILITNGVNPWIAVLAALVYMILPQLYSSIETIVTNSPTYLENLITMPLEFRTSIFFPMGCYKRHQ